VDAHVPASERLQPLLDLIELEQALLAATRPAHLALKATTGARPGRFLAERWCTR